MKFIEKTKFRISYNFFRWQDKILQPPDVASADLQHPASGDMAGVRSECRTTLRRNFDSTGPYVDSTVLGLYRRCSGLKTQWLWR